METISDEQLAARLQRGDRMALNALVDRHYDPLIGYLYRLLGGDRDHALDLAQETFLRALRGIEGYDRSRPFKPWLYAIATHLARDQAARAENRRVQAWHEGIDPPDDSPSQEGALMDAESTHQVQAALAQLPLEQREVVILFYYQDLSQHQIAQALAVPLGTVKSRLHHAVHRLRGLLEIDALRVPLEEG